MSTTSETTSSSEVSKLVELPLDTNDAAGMEDDRTSQEKRETINLKNIIYGKVVYFCWLGCLGTVEVYLSVFFKQMGFGPVMIGVIFGARPLIGTLVNPFWGLLADRWRMRRCFFNVSLVGWLGMVVLLGLYPAPNRQGTCPERLQSCLSDNMTTTVASFTCEDTLSKSEKDDYIADISWIYDPSSLNTVIVVLCLAVLVGEVFQAPSGILLDACVFNMMLGAGGATNPIKTYGAIRSMGSIGWASSTFLTGVLLGYYRHGETICGITLYFTNYKVFVYVALGVALVCMLATIPLNFEAAVDTKTDYKKSTDAGVCVNISSLLKSYASVHYASWFLVTYIAGCCMGLFLAFCYWYIENLGASQLLMGIDSGIQCVAEFLTFYFAEILVIDRIGHAAVMVISLLCYVVVFVVYAVVVNPWWVLLVAVLRGYAYASLWTCILLYFTKDSTSSSFATVISIITTVYWCLGMGSGKLFAGPLVASFGAVTTFYIYSVACVVGSLLFVVAQKFTKRSPTVHLGGNGYHEMSES